MWNGLHLERSFIDEEDIVSKLQLVAQIEKSDPYPVNGIGTIPLMERIERSLRYIDKEYQRYALALFANVIYLPKKFSHAVLLYLFNQTLQKCELTKNEFVKKSLFLEIDPTGIVNDFLRCNEIHGRLDKQVFQRTQQVNTFVLLARKALAGNLFVDDNSREEDVTPWLDKEYWVILADNALSGTSIESDLKRLVKLAEDTKKNPKYIILIRDLTSNAQNKLKDTFKALFDAGRMTIETGLLLDERYVVLPDNHDCKLFKSPETIKGVIETCNWLAELEGYKNDEKTKDHKSNSAKEFPDDDLRYGFKRCGLTLVTSENCPSNSLPLLWYKNDEIYIPPFPRVLSRIGGVPNDTKPN